MQKLAILVMLLCLCWIKTATAVEYGDLYEVDWCPCNPEERYDDKGSVVLGKTVMCPCDSMYDGYGASLEKDVRKLQLKTKQAWNKAGNFKYYVGFDYNKSHVNQTDDTINFDHLIFSPVSGIDIPANQVIDNQDNISIVIGTRPNKNFGIEAFYSRSYNKNKITRINNVSVGSENYHTVEEFTNEYQAFGVDLLGYLPVTEYFDFIAFVGVGKYYFDNNASFVVNYLDSTPVDKFSQDYSDDSLAWRVGGGVQFNIARGIVLRSMYRFIKLNSDAVDYLQEFSVGIRFLF